MTNIHHSALIPLKSRIDVWYTVPQTPVLVDMSTQSFELHFDKKDLGGV